MLRDLQQRVAAMEQERARDQQSLADRDAIIASLRKRIESGSAFQGVGLGDLFTVHRIDIVSQTGGADFDGQPGDDGVIVYVRPVDAHGDFLKAAGQFTVQLLDLTQPGAPRELAVFVFGKRDELARAWYGGLLTNHYTFRCALPPRLSPPPPREIHVRVVMLDWLTGQDFTASKTVRLNRIDPESVIAPPPAQ